MERVLEGLMFLQESLVDSAAVFLNVLEIML
jgi:hypothetical protein